MPLSIKKKTVELSSSSYDVHCMMPMPLSIKKEPVEMSDTSSSSTNNMPLNITDEMPDNVFLKIEIEENVQSFDSSFSVGDAVTNDFNYCKNIDAAIKDEVSKKKNLTEENVYSTEGTPFSSTDPNNIHEHNLVNSDVLTHTKNNNSLPSQKTKENASKFHVTDDSNTNHIPLPLIIPLQNIPCSSDNFGSANCIFLTRPQYLTNDSPNTSVFREMSNDEKHINNTIMEPEYVKPTNTSEIKYSENVSKCINNETLKPLLSDPFDTFSSADEQLSCTDARKIVEAIPENADPLMAQNIPFITEASAPILNRSIPCILKEKTITNPNVPRDENFTVNTTVTKIGKNLPVINKVRNESAETKLKENISSILAGNLMINTNVSNIVKDKSITNSNTLSGIDEENSVTEPNSVQVEKNWEVEDGVRDINKKTLKHNENNTSSIKKNWMLNQHFVSSILKEKPIINSHNLNEENSAVEPALLKGGKFWEIRDGKRNIIRGINKETLDRFIPTSSHAISSQNKSPISESLKNAEMKNTDLLQSKDNTDKADDRSCLNSYAGHNSTFLVENAGKTVNIRISEDYGESTNVQNSREAGSKSASQFQNKPYRKISNDRILFWSSFAANKSTILTEGAQKSVNENATAKINKSAPVYGKGALVYDRVNSPSQINTLADPLKPLYKYIKDNKCLLCGFKSKSNFPYVIKKHLFVHLPDKNFKCDICGKLFSSPDALSGHKVSVHTEKKSEICCKDCNRMFSTKSVLYCHRRKHHKPIQNNICSICNREFKEARRLKEHLRIHTGEKPYSCAVCDGTFRTRDALKVHSLKHNQKKLHSCKLCDKSYNRRRLLKEHMNSHNKTSDIKCKVCGKTFNYKSNLAQHMFTHTDERPHKCETCGLKFKLSHHFRSHLASHHT